MCHNNLKVTEWCICFFMQKSFAGILSLQASSLQAFLLLSNQIPRPPYSVSVEGAVDQSEASTSDLQSPFLWDICDGLSISPHVMKEERREVRYRALYAPVTPNRVSANGMQANNALHSSNSQRRNGFDSVECPALGALSSFTACRPPSPVSILLMLSIWRFMQKCAASRPPWSPSILSAGMAACHKLSYAEIVSSGCWPHVVWRLSCHSVLNSYDVLIWMLLDVFSYQRGQRWLHFYVTSFWCIPFIWITLGFIFLSIFYAALPHPSCRSLGHAFSLREPSSHFPSEAPRDFSPIWDIAHVQK